MAVSSGWPKQCFLLKQRLEVSRPKWSQLNGSSTLCFHLSSVWAISTCFLLMIFIPYLQGNCTETSWKELLSSCIGKPNKHFSNVYSFILLHRWLWDLVHIDQYCLSLIHSSTSFLYKRICIYIHIYIPILVQKLAKLTMCWNNLFQHLMHHQPVFPHVVSSPFDLKPLLNI